MKVRAAVLEEFNKSLAIREFDRQNLKEGEVLVKIKAASVCGSDVHMWTGKDPRIPLPIILGHEGVGTIEDMGGEKEDVFGHPLKKGDLIIWDRGLTCGECFFCLIKKEPSLCPRRKVYGISLSSAQSPHLLGSYSEYIHLLAKTKIIKIEDEIDPSLLAPAACSGATTAHALEQVRIEEGDTVVIQGPGPMGIFALSFSQEKGAISLIVIGTGEDRKRLQLCQEFGATHTLATDETSLEERLKFVREKSGGLGADLVIECTGSPGALGEGIQMVRPGGTYLIPGIATPTGEIPFDVYRDLACKNVSIQGVWVSDISHLYQAVKLILSHKYPFEKLITHCFSLEEASQALETVKNRQALKAVITP